MVATAPHNIPADAPANAAFTSGTSSHVQYPVAEVKVRDIQTTSGAAEGGATYNPAQS